MVENHVSGPLSSFWLLDWNLTKDETLALMAKESAVKAYRDSEAADRQFEDVQVVETFEKFATATFSCVCECSLRSRLTNSRFRSVSLVNIDCNLFVTIITFTHPLPVKNNVDPDQNVRISSSVM